MIGQFLANADPSSTTPWTDILTIVFSGAFGALLAHYFTKRRDIDARISILNREAEIRRREFRHVVTKWCCRLRFPPTPNGAEEPWPVFHQAITEITAGFALCGADFSDRKTIQGMIEGLRALSQEDIEKRRRENDSSFREELASELQRIDDEANKQAEQAAAGDPVKRPNLIEKLHDVWSGLGRDA